MHILLSLTYIPIVVAIIIVASVAFIYRSQKYLVYFSAFVFTTALWLLCQYLSQLTSIHHWSLEVIRLSSALSGPIGCFFLLFVASYIGHKKMLAIQKYYPIPIVVLIPLNFTNLMIQQVEASTNGIGIKSAGILYLLQIAIVFLYFLRGIFELIRATIRLPKYARSKNYLLIFGIAFAVGLIIIGATVFASSTKAQVVVPIAILFMVLIISFAIVRHQLFDIRSIVAKTVAYLVSVAALGLVYGLIIVVGVSMLLHAQISHAAQLLLSLVLAIISISFASFKKSFDRLTNRIFFQDSYDTQELFDQLNRLLLSTFDLNRLLNDVSSLMVLYIKCQSCTFVLNETKYAPARLMGSGNSELSKEAVYELKSNLSKAHRRIISANELDAGSSIKRQMDKENVVAIIQLGSASVHSSDSLGMIILGSKKSGNPYNNDDLRVLNTIANELVIAIQNAMRFEEIQNFNKTLQGKVEQATKELRRTNEKLRQLDETKDEFISMASHQLRTPLTSVKGYLSMVLEGDAGKLNANQRKLLEQSYASSQRMVYLISDLLNLSRLNTGKFVIEPVPVDLSEVVQAEVEQLAETAKARELTLTYNRPATFPQLMLDETKIHQVVMNFIDNAIYYTPPGGSVTVELRETSTAVEYLVRDTGIGVPKAVQHKLFTKFYRAANAQQARPDGTGLGLFMAKKVVVAQGGSIIFESEEGKGSTFGFRFSKAGHMAPGTPRPALQPAEKQVPTELVRG